MYIRVYICYIVSLHDATTISNHVISLELMVEDATMRVRDSATDWIFRNPDSLGLS